MGTFHIQEAILTEEIHQLIKQGFAQHAIESMGFDGGICPFSFAAYKDDQMVGFIDCKFFWGQLHIRWLFVLPSYRHQGVGKALMLKVLSYAKEKKCQFAFVETMQFQAVDFYKKLGFQVEFSRPNYTKETTFHYLRKDL